MKKNQDIGEIKKKISSYRKRLNNIKKQGYHFSQDIYNDLDYIERKFLQNSIKNKIRNNLRPISFTIISFVIIIAVINIFLPMLNNGNSAIEIKPKDPLLTIKVSNLTVNKTINESINITGIASHSAGKNVSVNITILSSEHEIYQNIENIQDVWKYYLNITNLDEGPYTFTIYCYEGKYISNTTKIPFKIKHSMNNVSIMEIVSPEKDENVTGLILISGTIKANINKINKINIIIDEQIYKPNISNFNDLTYWKLKWNSIIVEDGPIDISIKCYIEDRPTIQEIITINVNNRDCPSIEDFKPPNLTGDNIFQVYLLDLCEKKIYPTKTYTFEGLVRKKFEPGTAKFLTIIEVTQKPDWVTISISKPSIITPPDGEKYYFYIDIKINEDAPRNSIDEISIRAIYGIEWLMQFPNYVENRIQNGHVVTYYKIIHTGDW